MFMAAPVPASLSRESDGVLLAVNDAWLAATGTTREAVLGRTTVELGHWPSEAARQAYLASLALGPSHRILCLNEDQGHRVRVLTRRLDVAPEPLLLVFLHEISREF